MSMTRGCLLCIKITMFIFNLIFWLGGCGILGVGVWLAVTQGKFATLSISFPSLSAASLFMVTGSVIMVVGFIGCLGAVTEHRCLLLTFFVVLLIIFLLEIISMVLFFTYNDNFHRYAQEDLKKGLSLYQTEGNLGLTNAWDIVQTEFRCCGVKNFTDWLEMRNSSLVPHSCCMEHSASCQTNPSTWWKDTPMLNKHLQSLMEGLTAKVFRTYNASVTLQQQLQELTDPEDTAPGKILSYNRANRAVAILCNHQRAPPKTFDQSMANLRSKIEAKKEQILLVKKDLKEAKKEAKENDTEKLRKVVESKKKAVMRAEEQLMKLEVQATDREENKQIALSTSKLNYLDPRISVAWCKKWDVGLDKIYNKTYRDKFAWAVHMTETDFTF